jgi:acyl dehydratase
MTSPSARSSARGEFVWRPIESSPLRRNSTRSPSEAATHTFFRGLVASGWHTAALTMRLLADSDLKPAGGIIGLGFEELRWPRPVRPGDELSLQTEVLEVRPSQSRPEQGLIKIRVTTLNQTGEAVLTQVGTLLVRRRTSASGG